MTTAPFHPQPTISVVNPDVEPTDTWVRAIAAMLLADVDRERLQHPPKEKPREVQDYQAGLSSERSKCNDNAN